MAATALAIPTTLIQRNMSATISTLMSAARTARISNLLDSSGAASQNMPDTGGLVVFISGAGDHCQSLGPSRQCVADEDQISCRYRVLSIGRRSIRSLGNA